ncbi:hypothetical protein QYE76_017915 [Lolium multiflorum]|uniref:CCHC-type domain-containing protein n=1 Tax=Lolium multiflorum TaxID=4521 RepID=A0AAD8VC46_LOLMU|nr:hypothetical protein QYE76_017915 [Lolium multiflorum]
MVRLEFIEIKEIPKKGRDGKAEAALKVSKKDNTFAGLEHRLNLVAGNPAETPSGILRDRYNQSISYWLTLEPIQAPRVTSERSVPEAWLELPASCSWELSVSIRASSALTPSDAGSSGLPEEEEEAYCSEDIRFQKDIPTPLLPPSFQDEDEAAVKLKSNEVRIGPMTRARMKRNQASHEEERSNWTRAGQLDMELDMKTSHGRAREEREKDKDAADLITWRDYEALRNEMRREFRIEDDELRGTVQEISQKLDATNETVTTMTDQMTDIERSLQAFQLAVENLTNQQQQQDEDPDEVPGRGDRPRGWAPLGRNGRGHDEEDGLGKPKFSIPKFEGGADVEEYLTWELKIEKLWSLHPNYTEDRKIKLASSEFDGYALRWWDALVRNRQEDGEPPITTWRAMKEAMNSRFVPTNYLRTIYDKLTLLRQGVKTVDEYYMEMESLIQRGRVRESLEMTMQRFLHGLKYDIKGIVRFHSYTTMNGLLHHAREAESQMAEEAKVKGRATGAGRFTPRAPPSTAPAPSTRSAPYSTPPSKPVSNVSNAKKSESAASTSGSSMSTARNRDMACHTCGGKGHFKRDCPNRKVMIINEDNEYETGDDVDPNAPDDDDYDTDGEDAYPSDARTIVVSQRALNVLPSASTQRCNLFQTKALVGPDKACKVIIDGGSCRNHYKKSSNRQRPKIVH